MSKPPFLDAIDISATGLRAQRIRMNAIASNVANINTTRSEEGGPYKRQIAVLSSIGDNNISFKDALRDAGLQLTTTKPCHLLPLKGGAGKLNIAGVEASVELDQRPPRIVFDPGHPDADAAGYVAMPNIDIVTEMVNMISASRSYEANVTAITAFKAMARRAMEI